MLLPWLKKKLGSARNELLVHRIVARQLPLETKPFRHIIVDDAFPMDFYDALCRELQKVRARGLAPASNGDRRLFSRIGKYDAYGWCFPPEEASPLHFFFSKEWRDYIANLFDIECTYDIDGSFHYHEIGSKSGWTHNDFTAVSFRDASENEMNPWYYDCPLQTDVPMPGVHTGIRAIAILYYLGGDPYWKEGDGGETGLFLSKDWKSLTKKVAPLNNRLLLFEVSPHSYHAFISNLKHERNVIVQWLHQDPKISLQRFGVPYEKWRVRKPKVLLTGASGKLGMRFAEKYAPFYDIIGIARRKPSSTDHFLDFLEYDITKNIEQMVTDILKKHGPIDVLINNAVTYTNLPMLEKDARFARAEFETNFFTPYELIRAFYRQSWKGEGKEKNVIMNRSIINLSSLAGISTFPESGGIYSASKAALNTLTAHFALELASTGVRVNALAPAGFDNGVPLDEVAGHMAFLIEDTTTGIIRPLVSSRNTNVPTGKLVSDRSL